MKNRKYIAAAGLTTMLSLALVGSGLFNNVVSAATNQSQTSATAQRNLGEMRNVRFDDKVQRTVTNLSNGVQITLTSTDANTVTKLKNMKHFQGSDNVNSKITVTQTEITNGVKVTITSTDAATVTKIQSEAKEGRRLGFGGGLRNNILKNNNVQRKVTNTADGIQINFSSTDADTVKKLQALPKDGEGFGFKGRSQRGGRGLHQGTQTSTVTTSQS